MFLFDLHYRIAPNVNFLKLRKLFWFFRFPCGYKNYLCHSDGRTPRFYSWASAPIVYAVWAAGRNHGGFGQGNGRLEKDLIRAFYRQKQLGWSGSSLLFKPTSSGRWSHFSDLPQPHWPALGHCRCHTISASASKALGLPWTAKVFSQRLQIIWKLPATIHQKTSGCKSDWRCRSRLVPSIVESRNFIAALYSTDAHENGPADIPARPIWF